MGGKFAPKPSSGPHRMPDCIPLCILLLKKLKYVSTTRELKYVLNKRQIRVNGRVGRDKDFPLGIMDILTIVPSNENFRVLYNCNRRFVLQKIEGDEANLRLDIVERKKLERGAVPYIYTRSGLTFRYCDPKIKIKDTLKINNETGEVFGFIPFKIDMKALIVKGKNLGCVGIIKDIEKHDGDHDIAYIVDANGREFCTRVSNVFVIGDSSYTAITLPKGDGIKISEIEKSDRKYGAIIDDKIVVED